MSQTELYSYKDKGYLFDDFQKYFFITEIETGNYSWSDNTLDTYPIVTNKMLGHHVWDELLYPSDQMFFKQILQGKKKYLNGEYRFRNPNGSYEWKQCTIRVVETSNGMVAKGVINDCPSSVHAHSITDFRHNNVFRGILQDICELDTPVGIMLLSLDDFRTINELYTYAFGDDIIRDFSTYLQTQLPATISFFPLDGVSFGLLYSNATKSEMISCYHEIQKYAKQIVHSGNINISLGISAGICHFPQDGANGESLYRNVRIAFAEAKQRGKDQYIIYNEEISAKSSYNMQLVDSLRESIENDFQGFSLSYQPIIYAENEQLFGCEVLLRWKHPKFPQGVSPAEFIPILEDGGLIIEVGKWIIKAAFAQCKKWTTVVPSFQMSINVAFIQFVDPNFISFVMDALADAQIESNSITLELTESGQISNTDDLVRIFDFLRSQGFKIALDDFGTGYDTLSCLRLLSADELKIDRSFLERITYNVTDQKILAQIISMCESMNMFVCVEGVESQEVKNIAKQLGAKLIQGYLYGKPMIDKIFTERYISEPLARSERPQLIPATPEYQKSMVYSAFKPAQSMSMDSLIELAYAGIFQVGMDHEFSFLTCNEGYRRMLGYTAKEIDEKFKNQALGFVHPDDAEYVNNEIRRQLGIGDTVTIEFRIVRSDGTPLWILGTGTVIKGRNGTSSLIVVILDNDIFKKKALETQASYDFYKGILDGLPTGIKVVRFDSDFTLDYISPGFLSIIGYDENDIKNEFDGKYINLVYEEDRQKVFNDVSEQLKLGPVVTMRYRSYCKDGRLIWVETVSALQPVSSDGIQRAYSNVVDVTDTISEDKKNRALSLAMRYQEATKLWGDVLFEYQFETDAISFSDNFQTVFGRTPQSTLREEIIHMHPTDVKYLLKALEDTKHGRQIDMIELRLQAANNKFIWCSIAFNEPDYIGDVPFTALGKISNIDVEKREKDDLMLKSQMDLLTGLFNKATMEGKIREKLTSAVEGDFYALLMFDIDNFKYVNDTYGHPYGDALLKEIAHKIKGVFRENDIIGRAGGDEFMVLMRFDGDRTTITSRVDHLLKELSRTFLYDKKRYDVHVSVGISCYPFDGTRFYDLFRKADSALYRVKLKEKNSYCLFSI